MADNAYSYKKENWTSASIRHPVYVMLYLSIMCMCITACTQLFAPFVPIQSLQQNLDIVHYMWFFAIYSIFRNFTAGLVYLMVRQNLISHLHRFEIGVFLIGITTLAWGFLDLVGNNAIFFWVGLILRIVTALGIVSIEMYASQLIETIYPTQCYYFLGLLNTICTISYIVLMPLMGWLAEAYWIEFPFLVFGGLLVILSIITLPITPDLPSFPKSILAYPNFFSNASTWIALIISLITHMSQSLVYTILTDLALVETSSFFTIGLLFMINKAGYITVILVMVAVPRDMKAVAIIVQLGLACKMFSYVLFTSPYLVIESRFQSYLDYLFVSAVLAGVADAMLLEGAFLVLVHNADCFFGSLMAGLITAGFGYHKGLLIMAYAHGCIVIVLVPFITKTTHDTQSEIRRRTVGYTELQTHGLVECSELQEAYKTERPSVAMSVPSHQSLTSQQRHSSLTL